MRFKAEVSIKKLMEHPMNRELFNDIQDTDPVFWNEFKDSIREFGVIEPLIVNEKTLSIRSGNQRFKAAVQIGLETVPVVYVEDESSDDEIAKMIASNVYRRTIDPFAMFGLIGRLRKGHDGTAKKGQSGLGKTDTREKVKKSPSFVTAADIFNELPEDQKSALEVWFGEKENRTEGELVAQLKELKHQAEVKDVEISELSDIRFALEGKQSELESMVEDMESELADLRDSDHEDEIADLDAEIGSLESDKRKLKERIKALESCPDLHLFLEQSIKRQKETNAVLKEIVEHRDALNQSQLEDLVKLIAKSVRMLQIEGDDIKKIGVSA